MELYFSEFNNRNKSICLHIHIYVFIWYSRTPCNWTGAGENPQALTLTSSSGPEKKSTQRMEGRIEGWMDGSQAGGFAWIWLYRRNGRQGGRMHGWMIAR